MDVETKMFVPSVIDRLPASDPVSWRDPGETGIVSTNIFFWKFENWPRHARRDQHNMWEHVLPVRKITCHLEPLQHPKTTDCNGSPRICLD